MPAWLVYLFVAAIAAVLTLVAVPHLPDPANEIFTWVGWIVVIGLLIYAAFAFFASRPRI